MSGIPAFQAMEGQQHRAVSYQDFFQRPDRFEVAASPLCLAVFVFFRPLNGRGI